MQAETAANFPPSVSDFFGLHDLLSPAERDLRLRVRSAMEQHVAPIMAEVTSHSLSRFTLKGPVSSTLPGSLWHVIAGRAVPASLSMHTFRAQRLSASAWVRLWLIAVLGEGGVSFPADSPHRTASSFWNNNQG